MCRFVLYHGAPLTLDMLTTRPNHSLIHQSFKAREREEPLNGDGFGIAWYVPELSDEPAVFRSTTPAWNNPNLRQLARVTRSHCILAHVRAATPPLPVTELNCHPFTVGPLALMHNGFIPSFDRIRRRLLAGLGDRAFASVRGSTDSEHILAMLLDRYDPAGGDLAGALARTLRDVEALVRECGVRDAPHLNVAVSDGRTSVVTRRCPEPGECDSLYVHEGMTYVCEDGVCRMVEPDRGDDAVIVASEPLSDDPGWELVPPNHMVVIHPGRNVDIRPL